MDKIIDLDELSKYAKMQRVLNFNFSTNMLFRCTTKKYANDFQKGRFRFNQPEYWIKEEEKGNKGLGDSLEGTFLTTNFNDNSEFINNLKKNDDLEHFIKDYKLYFRRKNIKKLYCFCLYGLNDDSFKEKSIDRFGKEHYYSRIDKDYFSSFSNGITKEKYNREDENRNVVIFINNPHLFFEKIRQFFIKLGVSNDNIIISPVQYVNRQEISGFLVPYPHELLLKDDYYSNQSEVRIIINSTDSKLIQYMNDNNNIIDIGDISDIVDIYDYYFDDLMLEKNGNVLLFTLPFPIEEKLDDMTLRRLLSIFVQVSNDELPYDTSLDERFKIISLIKEVIRKKYNIFLSVEDGQIRLSNVVGNLEELLDK